MNENNEKNIDNKTIIIKVCIILAIVVIIISTSIISEINYKNNHSNNNRNTITNNDYEFEYKIIKKVNDNYESNYLISPLSIGYALNMLDEGSDLKSKNQIDNLLGNYKIDNIDSVENVIGIANGLFINEKYKNNVKNSYINKLTKEYNADIKYTTLNPAKTINDWISNKTFNMVNEAVKNLNSDFVLAIANAIAIDVEWKDKFKCISTRSEKFTLNDGKEIDVAMMHNDDDDYLEYIESDDAKGIIKPYKKYGNIELEYIAILPNDGIETYIKTLNKQKLNNLLSNRKKTSGSLSIKLSLPKYTYDFDYSNFKDDLIELGVSDVFDKDKADLSDMISPSADENYYVSEAIHKSHIELSESGTKAAAVTVFIIDKNAAMNPDKQIISIKFNRPFIYLIKEKNSDNIWFFGTVYEPMEYINHTCETK